MRTAVIGASGYTGLELVRILSRHPKTTITAVTSERYAGQPLSSLYPALASFSSGILEPLEPEKIARKADVIFTAVPHKEAMQVVPFFLGAGKKVVDLSADFRFADRNRYESWYAPHTAPELLKTAVYGLPEINRKKIRRASLIANPGCYPTSIILPLMPFLKEDLVRTDQIIADSKSGASGAGRSLKTASLFCEVSEGFKAYNVLQHRHQPEIEDQLSQIAGRPIAITFSPHLLPMNRGMLSTIYLTLKRSASPASIRSLLGKYYRREQFIRLLPEGTLPQTGWVRGSNYCDIAFCCSGKRLVLLSAIDNLVKGASGQAVQNLNIMMGWRETAALDTVPLYP